MIFLKCEGMKMLLSLKFPVQFIRIRQLYDVAAF